MYEVEEHNREDVTLKNAEKVIYISWKQKVKQIF